MDYHSYRRTQDMAERRERLKRPGQDFCDHYGWKLGNKYDEIQRPDKITWCGGTMYRTITPTTHIWYKNKENNEHVWIEFNGSSIIVKRGIRVTTSPGCSFNTVQYNPDPDKYNSCTYFGNGQSVVDYLLR